METSVSNTQESLQVGRKAPAFSTDALMPDGSFKKLSLSDFKAKWVVLFFYPLDFTFVCPTEIRSFDEHHAQFKKAGAEVLSVSTDSVFSHKAWVAHGLGKVQFPMLADTPHELSKAYGVLIKEKGIALRGTFIIDPDGILRWFIVSSGSVGRSVKETVRALRALQSGELCPVEWEVGGKTLGKAK